MPRTNPDSNPRDDATDSFGPFDLARRWFGTLWQVRRMSSLDQISLRAAGVAFFFFLAVIPALAAIAAVYSLVADPSDVVDQIDRLDGILPDQAITLVETEMESIAHSEGQAGWGLALGLVLAVWGSSKGMDSLIRALNAVYREQESRGFFRRKFVAITLTLGGILMLVLVIGLLVVTPWALGLAGLRGSTETFLGILRWPALFLAVTFALAVIYRIAPYHRTVGNRLFSPGTFAAAAAWVLASAGLSAYASQIGNFSKTYGSLAAVVTLMLWFYLSALIILLGAELNAVIERRALGRTLTPEEESSDV